MIQSAVMLEKSQYTGENIRPFRSHDIRHHFMSGLLLI